MPTEKEITRRHKTDRRKDNQGFEPKTVKERLQVVWSVPAYWVVGVVGMIAVRVFWAGVDEAQWRTDLKNEINGFKKEIAVLAQTNQSQLSTNQLLQSQLQDVRRDVSVLQANVAANTQRLEKVERWPNAR